MPLFGPPNVEKMRAEKNVKALLKVLSDGKDLKLRKAAALALGEIRDLSAVLPLIKVLKNKRVPVNINNPSEFLANTRENNLLRAAAAQALGEIGDVAAWESLTAVHDEFVIGFSDGGNRLHEAAGKALEKIGPLVLIDNRSTSDNMIVNSSDMHITVACNQPQAGKFSVDLQPGQFQRVAPNIQAQPYPYGKQKYEEFQYQLNLSEVWNVHLDDGKLVMEKN